VLVWFDEVGLDRLSERVLSSLRVESSLIVDNLLCEYRPRLRIFCDLAHFMLEWRDYLEKMGGFRIIWDG
jgi:hypothetical protein